MRVTIKDVLAAIIARRTNKKVRNPVVAKILRILNSLRGRA